MTARVTSEAPAGRDDVGGGRHRRRGLDGDGGVDAARDASHQPGADRHADGGDPHGHSRVPDPDCGHTTLRDLRHALHLVEAVLAANDGRYRGAWRQQSVAEHVRDAWLHLEAYEAGDASEPHLQHALCRLMFVVTLDAEQTEGRR